MDTSIKRMREEFEKDFHTLLSSIDSTHYNPNSQEFKNAVMTGMMALLLDDIDDEHIDVAKPEGKYHADVIVRKDGTDEVKEEMEGAESYYQRYKATNDAMFKQMSQDELRHADYLLRQKMQGTLTEAEKQKYTKYGEWIKNFMAKLK